MSRSRFRSRVLAGVVPLAIVVSGCEGRPPLDTSSGPVSTEVRAQVFQQRTFLVTDDGGNPTPAASCPGCDPGSRYTLLDANDALRVLYTGVHHEGSRNCASD